MRKSFAFDMSHLLLRLLLLISLRSPPVMNGSYKLIASEEGK
jgi:hypothetical protein